MHEKQLIETRSQDFRDLFDRGKTATRLSSKLSAYSLDDRDGIRKSFEELIGKPVDDPFYLIPPFYTDYGLNIRVGRAVFIGYEYTFTGHAAINIADQVMIAHKVNLVTAGHPVEPDKRNHDLLQAGTAEIGLAQASPVNWPSAGLPGLICSGGVQIYAWWEDLPSAAPPAGGRWRSMTSRPSGASCWPNPTLGPGTAQLMRSGFAVH